LRTLQEITEAENELDEQVRTLRAAASSMDDERLNHELSVNLGVVYSKANRLDTARQYFQEAVNQYCHAQAANRGEPPKAYRERKEREVHREAVTSWLLGTSEWRMATNCNHAALEHWTHGLDLFKLQAYSALRVCPNHTRLQWYRDRIHDMSVWMACTLEGAHAWLNLFSDGPLDGVALRQRTRMDESLRSHAYPQARLRQADMLFAARRSSRSMQLPEALLESGRAEYQMGNLEEAARFLEKAALGYPPDAHAQAVARWMLGCVHWQTSGQAVRAALAWQKSIHQFQALADEADLRTDTRLRQWYLDRIQEMQAALVMEMNEME
jgi:tetratricopeptide (TPR) repeat protein